MIQLTPTEISKLEGIVMAGGLTREADVVRVPVRPSDPELASAWKRYLARNYDSLVAMAQRICGPLDLILFDGNTVTVCRHPQTRMAPERIRNEVFSQLSERLFGRTQSPAQWSKMARESAEPVVLTFPDNDEEMTPQMEAAVRLIMGQAAPEEAPPPPEPEAAPAKPPLDVKMQKVVRGAGQSAVWLRASQPSAKAGEMRRDYFRADADIVEFDIQLAFQAAEIANRMMRENQPGVQLMFPLNINTLRTHIHRQKIVTALRDLDGAAALRMEPVLVRCETGVPQSVISEAAGYMRKTFGLVWVFAGRNADPRTFLWSDSRMGLVVSGADTPKPQMDAWRAATEKAGWQLGVLS